MENLFALFNQGFWIAVSLFQDFLEAIVSMAGVLVGFLFIMSPVIVIVTLIALLNRPKKRPTANSTEVDKLTPKFTNLKK